LRVGGCEVKDPFVEIALQHATRSRCIGGWQQVRPNILSPDRIGFLFLKVFALMQASRSQTRELGGSVDSTLALPLLAGSGVNDWIK